MRRFAIFFHPKRLPESRNLLPFLPMATRVTEFLRIFAPCKQIARLGGASAIGASSIAFSLHEPCARYDKRKDYTDRQRGCVQQTVRMGDAAPAGDGGALGPAASLVEEPRRADGQRLEPLAAALDLGRFACKELRPVCAVSETGRRLLIETRLPVSEIAYQLGFEYPQHFSRLFKSRTGMTPNKYRLTA